MSPAPTTGRRLAVADTVTAAVLLVVGLLYGFQALREGIGTAGSTGAGFFPLLVAVTLVLACGTILLQELRAPRSVDGPGSKPVPEALDAPESPEAPGSEEAAQPVVSWFRVAGIVAASVAVPALAETLGFVTTLSVAVVVIAKIMGMPGVLRPAALGAGFAATVWLVFVYWLYVPLPIGSLGLA